MAGAKILPNTTSLALISRPASVLFDLDGVLLDTEPINAAIWLKTSAEYGLQLNQQQLMSLRGRRRSECIELMRCWIESAGYRAITTESILATRAVHANELFDQINPIEGAQELVSYCNRVAIPMALVTSSTEQSVMQKCKAHQWLSQITVRIYGNDPELRSGKPHPHIYKLAAKRIGVAPALCWVLEDSPAGVESAARAGCQVIALPPKDLTPTLLNQAYSDADLIITGLDQALNILDMHYSLIDNVEPQMKPPANILSAEI